MRYKKTAGEWIFDSVNIVVMLAIVVVTIYPLLNVLAISLNDGRDTLAGGIGIIPRKFSFDSYVAVLKTSGIENALIVSVIRTLIGTVLSIFVTSMTAYAMLDSKMPGYKWIYRLFVVSMFMSSGLIPTFLLYKNLHLYNNFLVYILPGVFSAFNMILFRTYMKSSIPAELVESALLDGAGSLTIFVRIMIPLSVPIIATISLFVAVGQWNSWQDTLYFTQNPNLETLQYLLMKVLRQSEASYIALMADSTLRESTMMRQTTITPDSIKMAITMVATVPILMVYPFVQRYFVKGIMIGAVKG